MKPKTALTAFLIPSTMAVAMLPKNASVPWIQHEEMTKMATKIFTTNIFDIFFLKINDLPTLI
jgi:hypothetical protein